MKSAELNIFEPPRFFEALLRGRAFTEAPDITARICGICPVAYQMSAVHAMENALGVTVDGPLRDLRRLLYCGEWIESHMLHIYMLHAPDFLGYDGGIEMARDHGDVVRRGLALKKVGNEIMTLLGGREIHPINVRVGGFYRAPRKRELAPLAEKLKWARDAALETVRWVASFDFPDRERDYDFRGAAPSRGISLQRGPHRLESRPRYFGRANTTLISRKSTSSVRRRCTRASAAGGAYLVGPLARYTLNFDRLSPLAQEAAREAGLGPVCAIPIAASSCAPSRRSMPATRRCASSTRYEEPERPCVADRAARRRRLSPRPRRRAACSIIAISSTADGTITEAQHRAADLAEPGDASRRISTSFVGGFLDLPDEELRHRCEQTVRNYDPCISCATHFLRLDIDRG